MGVINDDAQLVSMARDGDTSSYEQLFERYQGKIYNFVYGISGNAEDAKDVTQEAFIKVFEALPRIEKELNFSAYLYRTAHNLAIDELKTKRRFASEGALEVQEDSSIYVDPERAALLKEQQAQVRKTIAGMSDEHRAVLSLRELQDLSYDQISSVLEIPKNTVGVLLSRARLKFKGALRMSQVDIDKLSQECKKMLSLLSAFVDNELTQEERGRVEEHLKDCPLCRLALEEMTEASRTYRCLIPLVPPAAIKAGILSGLAEAKISPFEATLQMSKVKSPSGAPAKTDTRESTSSESTLQRTGGRAFKSSSGRGAAEMAGRLSVAEKILIGLVSFALFSSSILGIFFGLKALGRMKKNAMERASLLKASNRASEEMAGKVQSLSQEQENSTSDREGSTSQKQSGDNEDTSKKSTALDKSSQADTIAPKVPTQLSPSPDALLEDPNVILKWSAVTDPSGLSYTVEIQRWAGGGEGFVPLTTVGGLRSLRYSHGVGELRERWRVWAVDGAGNTSAKTGWWGLTKASEQPSEPTPPSEPPPPESTSPDY